MVDDGALEAGAGGPLVAADPAPLPPAAHGGGARVSGTDVVIEDRRP